MRAGFPHSDIFGSKPVCRLPEAFRKLLRPSSPVIAKASTTCTYSLDPITLPPTVGSAESGLQEIRACARFHPTKSETWLMQSQPVYRPFDRHTYFFQIVNEQTDYWPKTRRKPFRLTFDLYEAIGGGDRNRTDDPLLAKQVLSQLSYTPDDLWWVWVDLNHRPHAYQACALTN